MRIAKVIGTVVLGRPHTSFADARLKLAIPMNLEELAGDREPHGESIVVYDNLGAGEGALIAVSEGAEAAQPFYPEAKPIDAFNAAILDHVEIRKR